MTGSADAAVAAGAATAPLDRAAAMAPRSSAWSSKPSSSIGLAGGAQGGGRGSSSSKVVAAAPHAVVSFAPAPPGHSNRWCSLYVCAAHASLQKRSWHPPGQPTGSGSSYMPGTAGSRSNAPSPDLPRLKSSPLTCISSGPMKRKQHSHTLTPARALAPCCIATSGNSVKRHVPAGKARVATMPRPRPGISTMRAPSARVVALCMGRRAKRQIWCELRWARRIRCMAGRLQGDSFGFVEVEFGL